jgi:hypothetical protein
MNCFIVKHGSDELVEYFSCGLPQAIIGARADYLGVHE